jgi:tRNA-2-methylthio-N6-dimethylallyladenosine synthase
MYSPRPGTLSARWEDDIPHAEKLRRHHAWKRCRSAARSSATGAGWEKTYEVLVETSAKGRWTGRTRGTRWSTSRRP